MFKTGKLSTKKLITLAFAVLTALLLTIRFTACGIVPSTIALNGKTYSLLADTDEQTEDFLIAAGLDEDVCSCQKQEIVIPQEFNGIYAQYNAVQKEQGFNLEKYKGRHCERYIYYLCGGSKAEIIVYKGRIIAADKTENGNITKILE